MLNIVYWNLVFRSTLSLWESFHFQQTHRPGPDTVLRTWQRLLSHRVAVVTILALQMEKLRHRPINNCRSHREVKKLLRPIALVPSFSTIVLNCILQKNQRVFFFNYSYPFPPFCLFYHHEAVNWLMRDSRYIESFHPGVEFLS